MTTPLIRRREEMRRRRMRMTPTVVATAGPAARERPSAQPHARAAHARAESTL